MKYNDIKTILKDILVSQEQNFEDKYIDYDKLVLGSSKDLQIYNTRPITLYNCYTFKPWTFKYMENSKKYKSNIFRIEAIDEDYATFRILQYSNITNNYLNTNKFFIINLNSIGAIECLPDTFLNLY